jgi:hypothetical protein
MKKFAFIHISLLLFMFSNLLFAQQANDMFLHAEFVKENKIAIRLLPTNIKAFEDYKDLIIEIKKFKIEGNNKIADNKLVYLKPFGIADTATWMNYIRKNNDQAAFVYQYIHPSNEQIKNKSPNQETNAKQQLFNLFLLNCDYSSDAATAAGLLFKDSLIDNQSVYSYSFSIGNKQFVKRLFEIKIDARVLTQNPKINNLTAKNKKGIVTTKLDVSNYRKYYSAYYVERSTDGKIFNRTSKVPYVYLDYKENKEKNIISINDSIKSKEAILYYRIKGVNFFGEESEPSNLVTINNYQEIKSYPNIDTIKTILNKMVLVKWKMLDSKETPLIKNFILLRAIKDSGPYTILHQNKSILQFVDNAPLANNFYKVMAITQYDDTLQSFSRMIYLNDTTPPISPKNLKAIVDKKGNVTVTWNKNTEPDLNGYRIFKANSLHEEFVSLNEKFITDTVYKETLPLNNLAHYVYYSCVATDKNFNSSKQSTPFKLRRPDTIAPVKPIITEVKLLQQGIKLFFSPSKSEDVELHSLTRSNVKDNEQKTVLQFLVRDTLNNSFIDTSAVLGESYSYTLTAFDEDVNKSSSTPRFIIFETGFRPKVKDLNAKVDLEKRKISLSWANSRGEVDKYILYRASDNEPYTIITTLEPNKNSFIDNELNIGNTYYYKIKAVFKNGAESIFNNPIKVIY